MGKPIEPDYMRHKARNKIEPRKKSVPLSLAKAANNRIDKKCRNGHPHDSKLKETDKQKIIAHNNLTFTSSCTYI